MSETPNYPEFTNEEINDFFNIIESAQIYPINDNLASTESSDQSSEKKPHKTLPLRNNIIIEDDIENSSYIQNKKKKEEDKSNQEIASKIEDIIAKYTNNEDANDNNNNDNNNNNNNNPLNSSTKTLLSRKRYSEGKSSQAENKLKRLRKLSQNKELLLEYNATCSICLDTIKNLANPDTCSHDFCKDCLIKWSKDCENTCPLCKKDFKKVIVYENNKVVEIKVKKKKQHNEDEIEYVYYEGYDYIEGTREDCMKCRNDEDWLNMLVCDECNVNVCHYYCDNLPSIPRGRWICSECRASVNQRRRRQRLARRRNYRDEDFD